VLDRAGRDGIHLAELCALDDRLAYPTRPLPRCTFIPVAGALAARPLEKLELPRELTAPLAARPEK
jgi:hypothetical protein